MEVRKKRWAMPACVLLYLTLACAGPLDAINLTGNIDADFFDDNGSPLPGVVVKDTPYPGAPPLARPPALDDADVPTGFNLSRVALLYDCTVDVLYVGYDVSNQSKRGAQLGPTSVAWDADGDGDPCGVSNPFLVVPGDLEPHYYGSDDLAKPFGIEQYQLMLDLNRDRMTDVVYIICDDGLGPGSEGKIFPGPCPGSSITGTLKTPDGTDLLAPPYSMDMDLVYAQDVELKITGLSRLFPGVSICPIRVITYADSELDFSTPPGGENGIDWGLFDCQPTAAADVSCQRLVNGQTELHLPGLPADVTYTLIARNDGNVPARITIQDSEFGTFVSPGCIPPGQSFIVERAVHYTDQDCGRLPLVASMRATSDVNNCVTGPVCGKLVDESEECTSTIVFPSKRTVQVTCERLANGQTDLELTSLPAEVTFTLKATNTGDVPARITINDSQFGTRTSSECVGVGQSFVVTEHVTYPIGSCGEPLISTMTATAEVADCAAGPVCGILTDQSEECSTVVRFPQAMASSFDAEKRVNGQRELLLMSSSLPAVLTHAIEVTNTGQSILDFLIDDPALSTAACDPPPDPDGKWRFASVGPGESRLVICKTLLPPELANCPAGAVITNTAIVSAAPTAGQPCVAPPDPSTQTLTSTVRIECPGAVIKLHQAYQGDSKGKAAIFAGYKGFYGDAITAVPGVFAIGPGEPVWSNFIGAANDNSPGGLWPGDWVIESVMLKKETPEVFKCSDIFPRKVVVQRGTPNIRLWWPLMYEMPGTKWTLVIQYSTSPIPDPGNPGQFLQYDDDGPGPHGPSAIHQEVWQWMVDADLQDLKTLLELFHELPFGRSGVPLVSKEDIYWTLRQKVSEMIELMSYDPPYKIQVGNLLLEFELQVADMCIETEPIWPWPTSGMGIANTLENPACCKLLADADYIAEKYGLFGGGPGSGVSR